MKMNKGSYIAAGAIIGVGLGMLLDNIAAYAVLGVGIGFLLGLLQKNS